MNESVLTIDLAEQRGCSRHGVPQRVAKGRAQSLPRKPAEQSFLYHFRHELRRRAVLLHDRQARTELTAARKAVPSECSGDSAASAGNIDELRAGERLE